MTGDGTETSVGFFAIQSFFILQLAAVFLVSAACLKSFLFFPFPVDTHALSLPLLSHPQIDDTHIHTHTLLQITPAQSFLWSESSSN